MSQPLSCHISETIAYIALGANDSVNARQLQARIARSLNGIESEGVRVLSVSRYYKTPCFPVGAGPDFVNAAAALATRLSPEELLTHLHLTEAEFGRQRRERWGMRPLDLDLLAYGSEIRPSLAEFERWRDLPPEQQRRDAPDRLILPHPRLQDRAFVLVPLADVAPEWVHPVSGRTVRQMCDALSKDEKRAVVAL